MQENRHKQKSISAFNRLARRYDRSLYGSFTSRLQKSLLAELPGLAGQKLCDIGCGTGSLLSHLGQHQQLAGLDISPSMLFLARQRLPEADLRCGDAEHLPWPPASFDLVTSVAAFHHFPDPARALAEIYRILRPGGSFYLSDWWLPSPLRQINNLLISAYRAGDVKVYSRQELQNLLEQAGFSVVFWRKLSLSAMLLRAIKKT